MNESLKWRTGVEPRLPGQVSLRSNSLNSKVILENIKVIMLFLSQTYISQE